jgi:hypothetical protein
VSLFGVDAVDPDDRMEVHHAAALELSDLRELQPHDTGSCSLREPE